VALTNVNEAYTSKTVSWTGEVKKIGGSRVIKDAHGNSMNRDLNGARGIFLRALVDTPWLRENLNLKSQLMYLLTFVNKKVSAGMNYTLHYIDQDRAAEAEFSQKVTEFVQKRQTPGSLAVRFPVVVVRDTLLFDQPTLATIQKHQ
jgi:regulatory protein YycI of two-component signal transduction system YycFG